MNGLVYGNNPRNGFFRGDWFYQPELAFKIAVPSGWQRQNLEHTVDAVAPNQAAAVQLTIAGTGGAQQAAKAFATRQGVTGLGSKPQTLGGDAAVVTEFQAAVKSGTVHGYATHVTHGQTTYELLAYAPESGFGSQQAQLERLATSFAPVKDKAILGIEAQHVEIVKLPAPMTLRQFAERYPSSIGLDELALINRVADPGAQIGAGTLLKRVTGPKAG